MTISGETIIVLGGWGLVGRAICHELLQDNPARLVICSLTKDEAEEAVNDLQKEVLQMNELAGSKITTTIIPEYGDVFARAEFKDTPSSQIKAPADLEKIINDTYLDLKKIDLTQMYLYQLIMKYKPEILIDTINTATIVAYKDLYSSVLDVRLKLAALEQTYKLGGNMDQAIKNLSHSLREHLTSIALPKLIRHIQILYLAMKEARCQFFVKIGTTGTGGMGLNIPYTHSEEKPSQKLLTKSAVAGAHSLLLFLMASTPDTAFTMEIKPAAAIAWKSIDYEVVRRGKTPVRLYDNPPEMAFTLGPTLALKMECSECNGKIADTQRPLQAVQINTGENGVFSQGEFTAITTAGQMEYVTPEEIARNVRAELLGGHTGHDIMTALKNSIMTSTYRAGFMRNCAIAKLKKMEETFGEGVAFEILGPPRLSKLLYEAYLLKKAYGTPKKMLAAKPAAMAKRLTAIIKTEAELRSRIISIGIPILLPDGKSLLRGTNIVSPPFRGDNQIPLNAKLIDEYTFEGWVDLRPKNMTLWHKRIERLLALLDSIDWDKKDANTSSRFTRENYLEDDGRINIGAVVGWIFNTEEGGSRLGFIQQQARRG